MTKQEVLELIARYIIKNDNGEITATVLQPILEQMVLQPNILIGRLELLNTTEKDSLVDAINSIASMNIDELVDTVQLLVDNNIEQDEKILAIETEVERLELEKADKTEIPDISGLATKVELSDGLDLKANQTDVDAYFLQINTEIGQVEQSLSAKIGDAPSDGRQYARQDEAWSEVISGGGGSLVKVDLEDGTVAYKLDSNDLIPTTPSIDLRAGNQETAIGAYAVCISAELPEGAGNTAEGVASTVSGGAGNKASGDTSTVSGGQSNTAEGDYSTVSGGTSNTAEGVASAVSGGNNNKAEGYVSTVSGGYNNTASGDTSTVSGGYNNTASGDTSTVSGGYSNTAEGYGSAVSGGNNNKANGEASTVSGGSNNKAIGNYSSISGGHYNTAFNYSETVVGMYSDNTGEAQTSREEGSPIFRVGIGTDNDNRKDGFIVTNEGNLKLPEAGAGIELKSPNGTVYKLTVSDTGELVITAV